MSRIIYINFSPQKCLSKHTLALSHSYPSTIFPETRTQHRIPFQLYPNLLSISPKQYTSSILSLSPPIFPTHACTATSHIKMHLYLFPENLTQLTFLYHRNSHNQSLYTNTFLTISTQITQMPLHFPLQTLNIAPKTLQTNLALQNSPC